MTSDLPKAALDRAAASRRRFLRHGAMTLGGAALFAASSAQADRRGGASDRENSPGYIDAHVHVWTNDEHYPAASPAARSRMNPPTAFPEDMLKAARPSGVDRIVLIQPGCYGFDNSYLLATIRKSPEIFRGVAVVDWHSPNPEVEMRKLKKHGVRGFRVYPDRLGGSPTFDGDGFQRVFRCAQREQMSICFLIDPDALPLIPQICQSFPDAPIAIDHLARIGAQGPIFTDDIQALVALAKYPRVKIKVSAFYALGVKRAPHDDLAPLIRRVYDAFGPQRMMWASDCPYQLQHETYEDSIGLIRDRLPFLSAEDKSWILRKSAEASFFSD